MFYIDNIYNLIKGYCGVPLTQLMETLQDICRGCSSNHIHPCKLCDFYKIKLLIGKHYLWSTNTNTLVNVECRHVAWAEECLCFMHNFHFILLVLGLLNPNQLEKKKENVVCYELRLLKNNDRVITSSTAS